MSDDAFLQDLAEVFEIDKADLTPEFALNEDIWDSLAIVSSIALIDEHYDITLSGRALADVKTIGDLLALIRAKAQA